MRFLHEDPWERLRVLRKALPNVCFQMLIRGSNAVGYKSYPDNVVKEFVRLAAKNGMDVFRIFDCFNDLKQMQLCIDSVRECNKVAEVCICFTGNFLDPREKIYTLDYYRDLAKRITDAGAHMIAIKDMAGLLRPQAAAPLMEAIRSVTDLPVHYHCHNTSSAQLATCMNIANAGCDIVDFAIASMADTTSQPSLNAFLSSMEGNERHPGIDYMSLEKLDLYWQSVRELYSPFESGLKNGTARVYDHQIPGGQYSNLIAQCKSMGLWDQWERVLDMYRDVNMLFGDIVKVTPSSKCVGDMALFLITRGLTPSDCIERDDIDYPDSVKALFHDDLSVPHHGLPKDLQEKVLKGRKPLTDRPGLFLDPVDLAAARKELEEKYVCDISEEQTVSSLLYPAVFRDFMTFLIKNGDNITNLPTETFFYGLRVGQEVTVEVAAVHGTAPPSPREGAAPVHNLRRRSSIHPSSDAMPAAAPAHEVKISLTRVGPLQQDALRSIEFAVDGNKRSVQVTDATVGGVKLSDLPTADPADPHQIAAPMPGTVEKVMFKEGDLVAKGSPLLIVSAMKMEVDVTVGADCRVTKLLVQPGDQCDQGSLVANIEILNPNKQDSFTSAHSDSLLNIAALDPANKA